MLRLMKLNPSAFLRRRYANSHQLSSGYHTQEKATRKPVYSRDLTERNLEKFELGAVVHGFVVEDIEKIDVFDLVALRLTHWDTGAQYLHLARDDTNNAFSIGFRTTPTDSTGLPHILEHMTLCGSEKYPCRDPFFKMLRRSLATFMNAMTGFDYTMYPFATVNNKDFKNLRSVYLDAVFKPNLRELDFKQEGWRLEHENVDDKNSPIIFKGVVFNEMKGVFSENENLFQYKFFNKILPSNTYGVCSGGDPLVIPQLKYTDLVNFHKTYYHPSNSHFFSYGTLALEEHLQFINDNYLVSSDKIDASMSKVPAEKRWDAPRHSHIECKPNPLNPDPNRSGSIAIGYLCNDICDVQGGLDLSIASDLLLSGPKSPFYKALIESKLGTTFGPLTGYHCFTKDTPFVLSLSGVKPETFGQVEKVFEETVHKVVEEGFTEQQVKAAVHSIELKMRQIPRNFGLQLLYGINSRWNHDGDIMRTLKINETLQAFEAGIKRNPKLIQDLVEKYFVQNSHKLVFTMLPKEECMSQLAAAEQKLLESKLKNLSPAERDKIYLDGQILRAEQEKEEDVNVLPMLEMKDIDKIAMDSSSKSSKVSTVPMTVYRDSTNGVCFYRGVINTHNMSNELKELLPLFCNAVTQMGTKNHDYRTFTELTQLKTNGLEFSIHISADKSDYLKHEEGLLISSHCLDRNLPDMWNLWSELFNNVTLTDVKRFETIVKSYAADLVEGIADSGHSYAMQNAGTLVCPTYALKERLSGLSYIKKIKKIAQQEDFSRTLGQMQDISKIVLNKQHLRSSVNCSKSEEEIFNSVESFYSSLKGTCTNPHIVTSEKPIPGTNNGVHHVLPFTVNYAAKAIVTVPYNDPEHAAIRVLAPLISSIYLHPEIREKGGAYGGGAVLSPNGVFFFYSYRDPNSTRTFEAFDKTADFLRNYTLSDNDLHQAKLQVLQKFCAPVIPSSRGMEEFLEGLTDEMRMKMIESVKATTKEDLMRVAEKYLNPENSGLKVGRTLIGPANAELSQRKKENWTTETA